MGFADRNQPRQNIRLHRRSTPVNGKIKTSPRTGPTLRLHRCVCCSTPTIIGATEPTSTRPPPDPERGDTTANTKHSVVAQHYVVDKIGGPTTAWSPTQQCPTSGIQISPVISANRCSLLEELHMPKVRGPATHAIQHGHAGLATHTAAA